MTKTAYNLIRGMSLVLNIAPNRRPSRVGRGINLKRSDADALGRDWQQVARDFRAAFEQTVKEAGEHVESQQTKP